jgi:putative transposase
VDHARATWQVSIRRACRALPVDRSTYHYRSRRAGQAQLSERIREIAATRVRYGYRRIHVLLRREGWRVNPKRVYRLYREMGLQLRNKTPKRRVKAKLREDRQSATQPNEAWAMDFVHDQLATGRKLRVLTIIDTFSRFSPAIEPRFNFRGPDVVEILEEVGRQVGFPKAIRVDQGIEFVSRDLDLWAYQRGVTLDFSRPGKPTDNAFIESFNGKFRAECLNAHWFMSLDDARRKCEAWRRDYNELRDRGALDEEECFIDATFVMAKGGGAEIGATKRGKGMNIMAIVDRHGLPLSVSTHAANHREVRLVQLCFDFYMIEAKPRI